MAKTNVSDQTEDARKLRFRSIDREGRAVDDNKLENVSESFSNM